MDRLNRAYLWLLVLCAGSTLVALVLPHISGLALKGAGLVILLLAGLKAVAILCDYLHLRDAPRWRRGFGLAIWGFLVVVAGLYLAA
ncbi:MAG: cytochrome C oxidase subunit IV family protein [Paracoccus sp. (in: a-proteobacteria)]|uniref:cytochrome C oxidase subunit IV family protein n=1 Tax=Paracoccus sp. TaxID=267 RepID=UPI0026DEFCE4|nr:cytochrome C oxidase subunit IV family protein [Paracoccus sp. (in: a-proteobacteria)]MDO5620849.1 cytochrome C oxidase subunit IV family protein [Paracoccus sp. (in: a-proteobacteria)]